MIGVFLASFWEGLGGILEYSGISGLLWLILGELGCFGLIFALFLLVLPAARCLSAGV